MRARLLNGAAPVTARTLTQLRRDARPGVQKRYATLKRRFERERDERMRLDAMLHLSMHGRYPTSMRCKGTHTP
jgi:hypothetical protein